MKEDKTTVKSAAGKENEPINENTSKKKAKEEKPPTKVVIRRLPPSMTEDQFKMQVSPIPDYDYFYFVPADMSLMPNAFSRAYINFIDQNDLFIFTQKFDGYVFVDSKGGEFAAVVEFAPFQRIPKNRPNRKKDSKVGTIEADPIYIAFKEKIEAENLEKKTAANTSKQHFFETSLAVDKKEEVINTPLLDFIRNKRAARQKIREEKREEKRKKDLERRKAKEEQRRVKKEDDSSVVKNRPSSPIDPNPKTNEATIEDLEEIEKLPSCEVEKENGTSNDVPPMKTVKTSGTSEEEEITLKVRGIVDFFSKTMNEIKKEETIKSADTYIPNCIKHEDLEREIMKNLIHKREGKSINLSTSKLASPKKFSKLNIPMGSGGSFDGPTVSGPSHPIPVLKPRGRIPLHVSGSVRNVRYPRSNSDIVMRPVRINPRCGKESEAGVKNFVKGCEIIRPVRSIRVNIPVVQSTRRDDAFNPSERRLPHNRVIVPLNQEVIHQHRLNIHKIGKLDNEFNVRSPTEKEHKESIMESAKKEYSVNNEKTKNNDIKLPSSSDTLRKNLEKVVASVVGNTEVCSAKRNVVINKPKTFVRRSFSGSGDQYIGRGYNSPNFYLPPRTFGFGHNEVSDSNVNGNTSVKNTCNAKFPGKQCSNKLHSFVSSIPNQSLPPFSKKSAFLSKSDGDIEKFETVVKVGGSEETLKRVPPHLFVLQRPLAPRKCLAVEKND